MNFYHKLRIFVVWLLCSQMAIAAAFAADEIHWTIMGQTSVTFDWRGAAEENYIDYGTSPGVYAQTVTAATPVPLPVSSPGPFWEAKLTGLTEDTLYYYSIAGGPEHTFRTPPPRGSANFTVYAEADVGNTLSKPRVAEIQSLIAAGEPRFVIVAGDISYADSYASVAAVDQHFNDVMVWSQDAAYMPTWGNHEVITSDPYDDLRNYKGRFDLPNQQASPGSPAIACCGEDWYWFDYGNVRFIAYSEPHSGAWDDWSVKAEILMDEAEADPDIAFIVTMGHRPAYSSGFGESQQLPSILDDLGANHAKYVLNIAGHSHNYERSFPQSGVVHITIGTGGKSMASDSGPCEDNWTICPAPSVSSCT